MESHLLIPYNSGISEVNIYGTHNLAHGLSFQALNEALKQVRADLVEATQNAVKVRAYSF